MLSREPPVRTESSDPEVPAVGEGTRRVDETGDGVFWQSGRSVLWHVFGTRVGGRGWCLRNREGGSRAWSRSRGVLRPRRRRDADHGTAVRKIPRSVWRDGRLPVAHLAYLQRPFVHHGVQGSSSRTSGGRHERRKHKPWTFLPLDIQHAVQRGDIDRAHAFRPSRQHFLHLLPPRIDRLITPTPTGLTPRLRRLSQLRE